MKSTFFVLLFLISREKSEAYTTKDILELAEESRKFEDLHRMLDVRYKSIAETRGLNKPAENGGVDVRKILEILSFAFMSVSYAYVEQQMAEYFHTAAELIGRTREYTPEEYIALLKNSPETGNGIQCFNNRTMCKLIGFDDDLEYCAIGAFHDAALRRGEIDSLFRSSVFVQTILKQGKLSRGELIGELRSHRDDCASYLEMPVIKNLRPPPDVVNDDFPNRSTDSLVASIDPVKRNVKLFSNMFCRWWRPYVSRLLVVPAAADVSPESLFIRHVLETERFRVAWDPREIKLADHDMIIWNWNCENILKSTEYGFEKYVQSVKKVSEFEPSPEISAKGHKTQPEIGNPVEAFTLKKLKSELKTKCNYYNMLAYHRIAADVVLYAAIKEGYKIFKGVKHVVNANCGDAVRGDGNAAEHSLRELRTTLSAFKSVFGRLYRLLRDKQHRYETETNNGHNNKDAFDKRVTDLVRALDVDAEEEGDSTTNTADLCSFVERNRYFADLNAHVGDNAHREIKFKEYYSTQPILHVTQLYSFIESEI